MQEHEGVVSSLQHQLEHSHSEAEELKRQLAASHSKCENAHQRAQLQEILAEQLLSQLQEATRQRGEYATLASEMNSACANADIQV